MSAALRRSLGSLEVHNYRRYFAGQIVSLSGNWMQIVAEMWLILELTGSGVAVGFTSALQFLPLLLFGAWGGVLADRLPKRRLLLFTQTAMIVPALALWGLTASGAIEPWMVFALVFARGAVNSVDHPTRQSFVIEMVGADRVVNAVGLNAVLIHSARIVGPAAAGILIATIGVAPCFLLNAATFGFMIVALRGMDPRRLTPAPRPEREDGGVRAALAYVRREPELLIPLAMMAVVGTLSFNFIVLLPLLGRFTFDGGPTAYTALAVAMGIGSVVGALATGARGRIGERMLVAAAAAFGACSLLAAAAPSLPIALVALVPLGRGQRQLRRRRQLDPATRGRPRDARTGDGALLGRLPRLDARSAGRSSAAWPRSPGLRAGLVLGGVAALATAAGGWLAFSRNRGRPATVRRLAGPTLARLGALDRPGGRGRRRLGARRPAAVQARGADQAQRLERRAGLDVEADPVAILDRRDRRVAAAPGEGDRDRVARPDRGDLRPDPARDAAREREQGDRPQAPEGDPARALGGQAGRGAGTGEQAADRVRRPARAPEPGPDGRRDEPPARGGHRHHRLGLAVGDHDRHRSERGRHGRDEQDGHPQQVAEGHQRRRSRSRKPSVPETTRSPSR